MKCQGERLSPDMPLREAAAMIFSSDAGTIPVCEKEILVGTLSSRDLVVRATAQGRDPARSVVRDVMSREIAACHENEDSEHAVRMLRSRRVPILFVVDKKRRLVGVVSLRDMVKRSPRRPRRAARAGIGRALAARRSGSRAHARKGRQSCKAEED